ncbi:hypoxia induced protein conserved region-domain-containing protein [Cokeromyces recurvatus]|uniref:hypoxia induced protein conserved region-domain-containing protein n=1 Tax=Cokeromyces recurvatus TaxID=90255 RepID=UPI0022209D4B|nr:hypoxia induced protein conserved region-domain-containing protein [Cokeromyces recurvatus]KAI7898735.1 hypoxia induced protein conserved region-domain-containing protein [Cokeromyces recurvatus]
MSSKEYSREDINRMRRAMEGETALEKIKRKAKEEPLVPAGVALTTFALIAAAVGVKTGNRTYTNQMFRLRVAAQGFTVLAMVGGSLYYQYKEQKEAKEQQEDNK